MKIKSIKSRKYRGVIYNLGVIDDESYTVEGIKVKNCRGEWVALSAALFKTKYKDPAKGIITTPEEQLRKGVIGIPASVDKSFDKVGGVPTMNKFKNLKSPVNPSNEDVQKVWNERKKT